MDPPPPPDPNQPEPLLLLFEVVVGPENSPLDVEVGTAVAPVADEGKVRAIVRYVACGVVREFQVRRYRCLLMGIGASPMRTRRRSNREGSVCRYRNLSPRRGTTQEDGVEVVPSYKEYTRCCQFDLV